MPAGVDLAALFGHAPQDTIDFIADKGLAPSWDWNDLAADAHARSFTVAKATRMDVLQTIRNALVQKLDDGWTERDFVNNLTPQLQQLGWWGKQILTGPGGEEIVQLGSPSRLRTIYRTNMASIYNAARCQAQLGNVESRPYWQYTAVMDMRTRPGHAALHGRVFKYDDPIWQTHYPPCDYNCRCRVDALTPGDLDRMGIAPESSEGKLDTVQQYAGIDKSTGEVLYRDSVRYTGTDVFGRPVTMTPGVSFGANPAFVPWQPNLDRYDADLARWYVGQTLRGPAFARTWQRIENAVTDFAATAAGALATAAEMRALLTPTVVRGEWYPVAVFAPEAQQMLDVQTQTVLLSDDTLLKQAISRTGQDFGLADYWRVQETIERAIFIARRGDNVVLFIAGPDGRLYAAVVKRTLDGRELFLTSFRRANLGDVVNLRRSGTVLKDDLQ